MTDITPERVLHVLSRHLGRANGISARRLAMEASGSLAPTDAQQRNLRHAIEALRRDGAHVCGRPSTGYFIAQTPDELLDTVRFLHDRALTSLTQAAAMQRVSLPDLRGQLRIPT